ncbi:MAG: hypothetical protein U0V75_01435 [Ferruginibacter sp.]
MTEQGTLKNYKPDYSVARLAVVGIAGFFAGCIILFLQDFFTPLATDSVFHEIHYNPRVIADSTIRKKAVEVSGHLEELKKKIVLVADTTVADKEKNSAEQLVLKTQIKEDSVKLIQLNRYVQYYEGLSAADSMSFAKINNLLHFNITPEMLTDWEKQYDAEGNAVVFTVNCEFKDPEMKITDTIRHQTDFVIKPLPPSDISFLTKYPSVGIWVLLILVFTSLCFMIIPSALSLKKKAEKVFEDQHYAAPGIYTFRKILLIQLGLFSLTMLVWKLTFFDDAVVKNIFFMQYMTTKLGWIIAIGVVAGSFCMAGFVHTASMLSFFTAPLVTLRKEIDTLSNQSKQAKTTAQQQGLPATSDVIDKQLDQKQQEEARRKEMFAALAAVFQTYFMMSALILSFTVLCTGALFNAIGSLDFVKLLTDDWGYNPVRNDFIYFYGALFTIVLLLVYIPAKIKFSEVDVWSEETQAAGENRKWPDVLKNSLGSIKSILVATSPLLVSLVQAFFDAIFK